MTQHQSQPSTAKRVAALNDIHGNLPALEAVLCEVDEVAPDLIVIGGDVAMGPMPGETLDRLSQLDRRVPFGCAFVQGNADRELVRAFDGANDGGSELADDVRRRLAWAARRLSRQQRDLLASFRPTFTVTIDGPGPVLFCHGSPRSDEEIITAVTSAERLRTILAGVKEDVIVCGHTHHQFDLRVDGKRVINAGSVGMPYEGITGVAYWALFGPDVELRATPYDFAAAIESMRAADGEHVEGMIASLEEVHTAQEVAEYFERVATGQGA
jgi:predicted phosphodiesterase